MKAQQNRYDLRACLNTVCLSMVHAAGGTVFHVWTRS